MPPKFDVGELRDELLAEIGQRIRSGDKLSTAQLMRAASDLAKLSGMQAPQAETETLGGEELDLFALVERLPAQQRLKHLRAERVRLQERLKRIDEALP